MPSKAAATADYASSLAHGLAVLQAFAGGEGGLANKALAERTGLSPASISRITYTLATRGLVRFDAQARCHRLDAGALTLAQPLLASLGVRRLARLPMKQVSDELGGTVSLGMRDRDRMVYVETLRAHDLRAFRPDVGASLPLLQSAIGRAWLAGASDPERREALRTVRALSASQYRRWRHAVAPAQDELARQGWCTSRGDFQPDVHAVAVPLDIVPGGARLVLNCGMSTAGLRTGQLERGVAPRLLRLARQIERQWHDEPDEAATAIAQALAVRPPDDLGDRQFSRTLARGIDLLQCFHAGEPALGNGELARRLGLSGPTVARLTHTLAVHGYLRRDTATERYARWRLGAAAVANAYPMLSALPIRELARPAMLALAEKVGGAVSLGLRHQDGMVYVETAWRTDRRLVPPDTGTVMPLLASAMGRAWLGGAEPAERERAFNQVRAHDPQGWSRHAAAARASIAASATTGWCWSRDVRPDVEAFGVPLPHPVAGVRYVMNCGVLAPRPLARREALAVGAALSDTVRALAERL